MGYIKQSISNLIKIYQSKNVKLIINVSINIILFLVFIACFKLPFMLLGEIASGYFNKISTSNFGTILYYSFILLYYLVSLLITKKVLIKAFYLK